MYLDVKKMSRAGIACLRPGQILERVDTGRIETVIETFCLTLSREHTITHGLNHMSGMQMLRRTYFNFCSAVMVSVLEVYSLNVTVVYVRTLTPTIPSWILLCPPCVNPRPPPGHEWC